MNASGWAPEVDLEVPEACAGLRVDRVVALLTGVSRSTAAELVGKGRVLVDGQPVVVVSHRVGAGQRLRVDRPDAPRPGPVPDPAVVLDVVYDDAEVIVVDKAPGVVVHPGAGRRTGTLVNGLLARYPDLAGVGDPERPGIVHRLDAGTSGLLVVARTAAAYSSLVAQLTARSVARRYLALVWGVPAARRGLIDAPIGRSARAPTRMAVSAAGREARTRYEVLDTFVRPAPVALVACRLETGRTHQIRVHLASIGHPVVGDDAYRGTRRGLEAPRPLLHASQLGFTHPGRGDHVEFESPVPADFAAVLARMA